MSTTARTRSSPTPGGTNAPHRPVFVTTHWSVVLTAGHSDSTHARAALEKLCQTYWYPLYAYVRRRGYSPSDAEDLTQGFFARLLKLESLADVRREKGRFRSFLLAGMNHYLSDERDRVLAKKRGAQQTISLDSRAAETRYGREPADTTTPERLFERQWALTLLETVVQRLRHEYEADDKRELFMQLRFAVTGDKSAVPYTKLAAQLDLSEEAVRVAVHRLRRRYRQLLREEIANTVTTKDEIADELQSLRRILAG